MVDAFIVSGEELAEELGKPFSAGPILVVIPAGTLSFSEYLELEALKRWRKVLYFTSA
jgi:hypothetical protein